MAAKESTNTTPYNYEYRRMIKKKLHLKTMEDANAVAAELYKQEIKKKTEDAIKEQGTQNATINFKNNISSNGIFNGMRADFNGAEIVDVQLDEGVNPEDVDLSKIKINSSSITKKE